MTFDSVPWVVTMKKNEHYFPTMELIKDPNEETGWRRVTYEGGKGYQGEPEDGVLSAGLEDSTEMDVDVGVAAE